MASQQNEPTNAAMNCLRVMAELMSKEKLQGFPWDQAAARANMSSGRSFRDTMRKHSKKNNWFGETSTPSSTTTTATAAGPATAAGLATALAPPTAPASASPAAPAAASAAASAAAPDTMDTGKEEASEGGRMVLRSGRKLHHSKDKEEDEESEFEGFSD